MNDLNFIPSKYQQDIFDFIRHGVGNAVVKASAGSGKTKTIVTSMKIVPKAQRCLFIAFNKSIVEELESRLTEYENCTVKTVHSLGYSIIKLNCDNNLDIDQYKYRTYIKENICELSELACTDLKRSDIETYIDNIVSLIDYSRHNLAQSVREIKNISKKYDIPILGDECEVTNKCLDWGKHNLDTIDYTDMVWLPYELSMDPKWHKYDWIFLDEAQDFSKAYVDLFLRCFKRGTRFVAVADEKQAINLFAGASEDAFQYMCSYPNTKIFDLPVSYRCDKKIVEIANTIVNGTVARENALDGVIKDNCSIRELKDGDMVLCRSKAPLMNLYMKLLKRGVKCYVNGKDIGEKLILLLNSTQNELLNKDLKEEGVFSELYDRMIMERNKVMEIHNLDIFDASLSYGVLNLYDNINTLITLSENLSTKKELIDTLLRIFSKDGGGICLSTIHKSKGLESDNVFILCNDSMPPKRISKPWEKLQERNIIYVAYTRAKHKLGFISEKEIPPAGDMLDNDKLVNDINNIEKLLCKVYHRDMTKDKHSVDMAKFNLKTASIVKSPHENDNMIIINHNNETPPDINGSILNTINDDATDEDILKSLLS